jgi:hypothetical protein
VTEATEILSPPQFHRSTPLDGHGDDLRGERVRGRGGEDLAESVDEGVGADRWR